MTSVSVTLIDCFSRTYREAREKFLAVAAARKLDVKSDVHPVGVGVDSETLAMDSVLAGPPSAKALLVLTSGTHGVEGYGGSGCQVAFLHDDALLHRMHEHDVAVLLVHAVNPWGFSYSARTNEDNVDLNRNFLDFAAAHSSPVEYEALHPLLVPNQWPPSEANEAALIKAIDVGGQETRRAMVGGQTSRPSGMFYAGVAPSWSNHALRALLRRHGRGRRQLAWIDLHTGLGSPGHGEKIFGTASRDEEATSRAFAWYGRDVVRSTSPGSITPRIEGYIGLAGPQECPHAEYTFLTLEFGALRFEEAMRALRGEAWLRAHPEVSAEVRRAIRCDVRRSFYVEEDFWKGQVVGQFRSVALQAIHGLSGLA